MASEPKPEPWAFECCDCKRTLPIGQRYGGPADQDPDRPVCESCIHAAFAEHG